MNLAQRVALSIMEDLNIGAVVIGGCYVFPEHIRKNSDLAVLAIAALAR